MATISSNSRESSSQENLRTNYPSPTVEEPNLDPKVKLEAALESSERFMKLGLFSAALDECYQAIALFPTYLPIHVRIGEIHAARGRIDEAIEQFSVIANLFLARGDQSGAAALYRNVVDLSPENIGTRARLVELLAQAGEEEEAEEQQLLLAKTYFQKGDLAGTVRAFDSLAGSCLAKGKRKRALGIFRVMKELAPGMSLPYLRLGEAYAEDGRAREAAAEYEVLVDVQMKQGKNLDAIATLKRIVQLDPGNTAARARLEGIDSEMDGQ